MKQSSAYKRGYKKGYNNPSQFDHRKLLGFDSDIAKGIIAGICQRHKDIENHVVKFIT